MKRWNILALAALASATPKCEECATHCATRLPPAPEPSPCYPDISISTTTVTEVTTVTEGSVVTESVPCPVVYPETVYLNVTVTVYTTEIQVETDYQTLVETDYETLVETDYHTDYNTVVETDYHTDYHTVVETDYHTVVETDYATQTVIQSYPVTVTTSVCTGPGKPNYPVPTYIAERAVEVPRPKPDCVYYTTTKWKTKTETQIQTQVQTQVQTETQVHTEYQTEVQTEHQTEIQTQYETETEYIPTTHYEVSTDIQVSTHVVTEVWSTITTYTTTFTYVSVVPSIVVSDYTEFITETYIEISTYTQEIWLTATETVTQEDTVTLPVTLPAETRTIVQDGETITLPAETRTVIQDGETVTLPASIETLPGEVTTLPGETITTTFTETQPAETITITENGEIITVVVPGPTSVVTRTVVVPRPPVTACPAPTNVPNLTPDVVYDPYGNLTFGCLPGTVCSPPKPQGCNLWADPPADDYVCKPKYCIPSPPYSRVRWPKDETGYVPPDEGYFNLNPNAFGLPFSIFEYETIVKKKHGKKITITTGDWASATELNVFPPPSPLAARLAEVDADQVARERFSKRQQPGLTAPAVCFAYCNNAYKEALSVGRTPELCAAGSQFLEDLATCEMCIKAHSPDVIEGGRRYVEEKFAQYLTYCEGQRPEPVSTSSSGPTSVPPVESAVTSTPNDVATTSQSPGETDTSAQPLPPSTTPSPAPSSTQNDDEPSEAPTTTPATSAQPSSDAEPSAEPTASESDDGTTASPSDDPTSDPAASDEPTASESETSSPSGTSLPDGASQSDGTPPASQTEPPSGSQTVTPPSGTESDPPFETAGASSLGRMGLWTIAAPVLAVFFM